MRIKLSGGAAAGWLGVTWRPTSTIPVLRQRCTAEQTQRRLQRTSCIGCSKIEPGRRKAPGVTQGAPGGRAGGGQPPGVAQQCKQGLDAGAGSRSLKGRPENAHETQQALQAHSGAQHSRVATEEGGGSLAGGVPALRGRSNEGVGRRHSR